MTSTFRRAAIAIAALGCSVPSSACQVSAVQQAPSDTGPPGPPSEAAPTGTRWTQSPQDAGCGRNTVRWLLEDELCNASVASGDLSGLVSPMFRDGLSIGGRFYAVDASLLWVLEPTGSGLLRRRMLGGLGRPLALATHGNELLIAAGEEGLLITTLTDPERPTRKQRIDVGGPALGLLVQDDKAYVAAGSGGLTLVDLSTDPAQVIGRVPLRGVATAVALAGTRAYVAACEGLAVVDLETRQLSSYTLIPGAIVDGVNSAPIKDVSLMGNTAFVAAGRYGAIAIELSDPNAPLPTGHCSEDDLHFYASGVRNDGQRLFIAGGEWGVKAVAAAAPATACPDRSRPVGLNPEVTVKDCSDQAPWVLIPPLPPAPAAGHDPIQVRIEGDTLYAFGDATRVGLRSIDLFDKTTPSLTRVSRFEEPRSLSGLVAGPGRLITFGDQPRLFDVVAGQMRAAAGALPADAVGAAFLEDGRWVTASATELRLEGDERSTPLPSGARVELLAASTKVALTSADQLLLVDPVTHLTVTRATAHGSKLTPAILLVGEETLLAAPEWTRAVRVGAQGASELEPHGVFSIQQALDPVFWREGRSARLLLDSPHGWIEVASLGPQAGLVVHGTGAPRALALPPASYVAGALRDSDHVLLVSGDRAAYQSAIVLVRLGPDWPQIESQLSFTGVAVGAGVVDGLLYVADADVGVRVYQIQHGRPTLLEIQAIGGGS